MSKNVDDLIEKAQGYMCPAAILSLSDALISWVKVANHLNLHVDKKHSKLLGAHSVEVFDGLRSALGVTFIDMVFVEDGVSGMMVSSGPDGRGMDAAREALTDPIVRTLVKEFDGRVHSVTPVLDSALTV